MRVNWTASEENPLQQLYAEEIRVSCLQGLLLCLDRKHRLAFLLADVFDVTGEAGAKIMNSTPATLRKRLSRAREQLKDFLTRYCSVVNPKNPCKCGYHVHTQIDTGRFSRGNMTFAAHPCMIPAGNDARKRVAEIDRLNAIGNLFKWNPEFRAPESFINNIREIVDSGTFKLLS